MSETFRDRWRCFAARICLPSTARQWQRFNSYHCHPHVPLTAALGAKPRAYATESHPLPVMSRLTRQGLLAVMAVACAVWPQPSFAQLNPAQPALAQAPFPVTSTGTTRSDISRLINLAELGFTSGVRMDGLGATQDLFFPIPRGLPTLAATLHLRLESQSIFAGRRGLEILANGRRILSRPLADGGEAFELNIPLGPEHIDQDAGFLRLTLRSTGALTDNRCMDQRLAGEHVTLLPETALALHLPAEPAVGTAALFRLMPRNVVIVTRAGELPPAEAAAALSVALSVAESGRTVRFATAVPELIQDAAWTLGAILVGVTQGEPGLRVARRNGVPVLTLTGDDPEREARLLAQAWRDVARGVSVSGWTARARPQPSDPRALPFPALRGDLGAQDIVDKGTWSIDFGARDLPLGTRPNVLALDISATPDSNGQPPVAAVFMNETLVGSSTVGPALPERLRIAVPPGLFGLENRVRVVVQRRPSRGECETPPLALPAQLLPSSAFLLAETSDLPADFFELAPYLRDGVDVLFNPPPTANNLGAAVAVLRAQVRPGTPITVRTSMETPTRPFVALTANPPSGMRESPVHFDRGRVVLRDNDGRALLDLDDGAGRPVAQLVFAGTQPGIWLRVIGDAPAVPPILRLDRGNVAFVDPEGVSLAWAAGRDGLVRITYPDSTDIWGLLGQYRPWIVGALWLAVTALIVSVVARGWRRRNPSA